MYVHFPLQFNPMVPFTYHTPGYITRVLETNKIHCVAFDLDDSTVDLMSDKIHKQLKDLQITVNKRGDLILRWFTLDNYHKGICNNKCS